MAAARGRDQRAPMERVIRLLSVLAAAGSPVPADDLVRVGGYRATSPDDAKRMLTRDLTDLNRTGWDIRNVAAPGEPGRWALVARDNRLRVRLTPAQRLELARAAAVAGRPKLAGPLGAAEGGRTAVVVADHGAAPEVLTAALRAVARHCLVRFTYKDAGRVAHPYAVHPGPSGWYLRAREEGTTTVKEFVVARMSDVALEPPGTAEPAPAAHRLELDPLRWEVDPPLTAVVSTAPEHLRSVEHLLGPPLDVVEDGDDLLLTYRVTHRGPFRWRLYELGRRVRLREPAELSTEVEAELEATVRGRR